MRARVKEDHLASGSKANLEVPVELSLCFKLRIPASFGYNLSRDEVSVTRGNCTRDVQLIKGVIAE